MDSMRLQLGNLLSVRFWMTLAFIPAIVAGMLMQVWYPLAYLWYPLVALTAFAYLVGTPLKCERCGKRVKVNYSRCRFCGHDHE